MQPVLQTFQERNRPEYIQRKAREKLEQEGFFKDEPAVKKRRPGSVEPLERPPSATPDLPEDFRVKQETLGGEADVTARVRPDSAEKRKVPKARIIKGPQQAKGEHVFLLCVIYDK